MFFEYFKYINLAIIPFKVEHSNDNVYSIFNCYNFVLQELTFEFPIVIKMTNILEVQHCDFVFGNRTFLHELYCLKFLYFVENSNSLNCALVDRDYLAKNFACLSKISKITFKDHFEFEIQFQLYNNCLLIFFF